MAQLDARPISDQEVADRSPPCRQHSFMEIDHEIFSTVILSPQLIQDGQLSVFSERMCTILVNCLEEKVWLGLENSIHPLVFKSRCSLSVSEKSNCLPDRTSNCFRQLG